MSVRGGAQAGVGAGALVRLAKVHCTSTAFLAAHQIFSNEIISNNKSNLISMENKKLSWSNINTFSLFFFYTFYVLLGPLISQQSIPKHFTTYFDGI